MKLTLRSYQNDALDRTYQTLLDDSKKKIGVLMPTGSGKTIVMAALLEKYIETLDAKQSVLVLSHKSDLVKQTIDVFRSTTDLKVGVLQGSKLPPIMSKVIVSTMQSSKDEEKIERFKTMAVNSDIRLIVIDECHYAPVSTYQKIFDMLPDAKILGFTATPWRQRHNMSDWFDTISYTVSLGDLIDEGVLLQPKLIQIKYEENSLESKLRACLDISKKHESSSGVVYVNTIEDAEGYRNAYIAFGLNADVITSKTPKKCRDRILDEYRKGEIKVLLNVNCLTEGIDAPIANYLIMPFGTKSPTVFQQRVGRVLRRYEGQSEALIYMFGDSPTIARGTYKKILDAVLKDGSKDPLKRDDVFDELEWMEAAEEKDVQKISWTRRYCDMINKIRTTGGEEFAALLQYKKFPPKYLKDLNSFSRHVLQTARPSEYLISEKQMDLLIKKGFKKDDLNNMKQPEASNIIASILSWENRHGEWSIKFGKFAGKHVSEIPKPYLAWMKKKQPNHPIFGVVKKWKESGGI